MKPRTHRCVRLVLSVAVALCGLALPVVAEGESDDPIAQLDAFIATQKANGAIDTENAQWRLKLPKPPQATFPAGTEYDWVMETNKGTIRIALMPAVAPMHVSSTIYLTNLGFYDGLGFHRVISGFMAQGGCPMGNGRGGPGYRYAGEFDRNTLHDRPYLLSMANAGPGTDGSQFFITFVPTPHLDGKHTVFGEVVEGQDVVRALEAAGSRSGATTQPLAIKKATIETREAAKREAAAE